MSDDLNVMSLDDLRAERARLQADDDRVSYARRAVQSRLDLVRAEQERRAEGTGIDDDDADVTGGLRRVLSRQLTGGAARPPRDDDGAIGESADIRRLDEVCAAGGFRNLPNSMMPLLPPWKPICRGWNPRCLLIDGNGLSASMRCLPNWCGATAMGR